MYSSDGLLIYRIIYFLRMAKKDILFFSPDIAPNIKNKGLNVVKKIDLFEDEIKAREGDNFNKIFVDLSKEKIYAIQSVMYKMFEMDESQCLEFESSLETIEK